MVDSIRQRIRARKQGINTARLCLYAFVWLLRKVSFGTADLAYKYLIVQDVPEKSLLGGRTGSLEVDTLEGERLLAAFDADTDGAFSRPPKDRPRAAQRVARGDVCVTASRDGRVLGTLWLTFGRFEETEVRCDFVVRREDDLAWDSNLYILEEARGGLIFAVLWDAANDVLRSRGYRATATMTSAFNGISLQSHRRLGARRFGRQLFVRLGPVQLSLCSIAPKIFLAGPSRRPTFVIPPIEEQGEGVPP